MGLYSRYVLPAIINCACGMPMLAEQRRKVAPRAEGVVLELGMGSGHNLPYYDPARVNRIYGLEPEAGMLARSRKRVAAAPVPVTVLAETAETVSLDDASVDSVVVTFSMCTIPDVASALRGAGRVLKPAGRLFFCEHGCSPDPEILRLQNRLEPLWKRLFGGCHLTRDIPALIQGAGFEIKDLEAGYMETPGRKPSKFAKVGGYLYRGSAALVS
jgi:SAM-dependent methyltransferase